jgi:tetratricopeptide (TPR) repeat protein
MQSGFLLTFFRFPARVGGPEFTALKTRCCYKLAVAVAIVLLLDWPRPVRAAVTHGPDDQICDPLADYFLGMEDYPEAIQRHLMVIREHPDDALAHYHLGFAYGAMGRHRLELREYQKAIELGLSDWQLFLNLGVLELERSHLASATRILGLAALLGPYRPETHYNLGLAYERRGMLTDAEQEMLLSLQLDPRQADVRNSLGVIYAEEGHYLQAHEEWSDLLSSEPDYTPARANLAILEQVERGNSKGARRVGNFTHAP